MRAKAEGEKAHAVELAFYAAQMEALEEAADGDTPVPARVAAALAARDAALAEVASRSASASNFPLCVT